MGEIADMHVEAFEAGLDPTEMDGADWADFYTGQESDHGPLTDTPEEASEFFASECRTWLGTILMDHAEDGDAFADVVRRVFPKLSQGQAEGFEHFLKAINGLPADE